MKNLSNIDGIIVPHVTPLTKDGEIDFVAFKKIMDILIEGGCTGIFINGTTGEFARLTDKQKVEVAEFLSKNSGPMTRYMNISETGPERVLDFMEKVKHLEFEYYVAALPFYYSTNNAKEQIEYYRYLVERLDRPLMIYNIPGNVNSVIAEETVAEVSKWDNVIGMKDSGGDLEMFKKYNKYNNYDSFRLVLGSEGLCAEGYKLGAFGCVASMANSLPRLYVEQFECAKKKEFDKVDKYQAIIDELNSYNGKTGTPMGIAYWRKRGLKLQGVCEDYITKPFYICPKLVEEYDKILKKYESDKYDI